MDCVRKYESKRKYRIWMYTVSHKTLILRSEKQYFDVEYECKYDEPRMTIDLVFNSVEFISLPEKIEGIEIVKNEDIFIINSNVNWMVKAANCFICKYEGEDEDKIWTGDLVYDEIICVK